MDVKPTRPVRGIRPRLDENVAPAAAHSKDTANPKAAAAAAMAPAPSQAAALKASARRAFGDVSNVAQPGKPVGKNTGVKGPARRVVKKTEIYADKKTPRKSPRGRNSPRKSAVRRDAKRIGPMRTRTTKNQVKATKRDVPTFSDQNSNVYLNTESSKVEEYEYDEVPTDGEYKTPPEARSEDDPEYYEDEEEEYTAARSRAVGDNTTGLTTQLVVPRMTSQDRKELDDATEKHGGVDFDDMFDITMVAEYGDEIFDYFRELEEKLMPVANYMDNQPDIQWSMRAILMDWIVQVHHRFGLLPETLYLCANYIDRFLSRKVVSLAKLQLVGATALFVAAKYEEVHAPSIHELVFMVDNGYSKEEIMKAEKFMLSMLNYELGWPGPMSFLRRVSKADDYDIETRTLAKYFLELTIMDERFVGTHPSFLAAGAHCFARLMLKKGDWTMAHTYFGGYTKAQLLPLVKIIAECCENPKVHHNAIYEKYSGRRFKRGSLFVENWVKRGGSLEQLLQHASTQEES